MHSHTVVMSLVHAHIAEMLRPPDPSEIKVEWRLDETRVYFTYAGRPGESANPFPTRLGVRVELIRYAPARTVYTDLGVADFEKLPSDPGAFAEGRAVAIRQKLDGLYATMIGD